MCGRYALSLAVVDFPKDFGVEAPPPEMPLANRYNIAPTQPVMIVREDYDTGSGRRELAHVVWGLIPSWAESPSIGAKMINARTETVTEKPAFRNALKRRRCLIPTTGFYEWRQTSENTSQSSAVPHIENDLFSSGSEARAPAPAPPPPGGVRKIPYYFYLRDEKPFAFAGLWEIWHGPDGELLESCTILTTRANDLLSGFHDRMPVILPRDSYDVWLNPTVQDPGEVAPLLQSYPADKMTFHEVSTLVNSPRNDGARLIERVD